MEIISLSCQYSLTVPLAQTLPWIGSTYHTFNSFISNIALISNRILNLKQVDYDGMCFIMIVQMYRDTQFEKFNLEFSLIVHIFLNCHFYIQIEPKVLQSTGNIMSFHHIGNDEGRRPKTFSYMLGGTLYSQQTIIPRVLFVLYHQASH